MSKKIELRPLISGFDFALLEVRNLCVASRLLYCDHIMLSRQSTLLYCDHIMLSRQSTLLYCDHITLSRQSTLLDCDHITLSRQSTLLDCDHIMLPRQDRALCCTVIISRSLDRALLLNQLHVHIHQLLKVTKKIINHMDICFQYLGFLDLCQLSKHSLERRAQIFSLSQPGIYLEI